MRLPSIMRYRIDLSSVRPMDPIRIGALIAWSALWIWLVAEVMTW